MTLLLWFWFCFNENLLLCHLKFRNSSMLKSNYLTELCVSVLCLTLIHSFYIFPACLQRASPFTRFWEYSNEQKDKNICPHESPTLVGDRRQRQTKNKISKFI